MKKHYYVLSGDHGYMLDSNTAFKNKGDVLQYACDLAKELRGEGFKVDGAKKYGYYEVFRSYNKDGGLIDVPGLEYIEVTDCGISDECLEDME